MKWKLDPIRSALQHFHADDEMASISTEVVKEEIRGGTLAQSEARLAVMAAGQWSSLASACKLSGALETLVIINFRTRPKNPERNAWL